MVGLDEKSEKKLADTIVGQKLSVRESEELVRKLKSNYESSEKVVKKSEDDSLELDNLVDAFKKLDIKVKGKKNKITLEFDSNDKIESFLERLNKIL